MMRPPGVPSNPAQASVEYNNKYTTLQSTLASQASEEAKKESIGEFIYSYVEKLSNDDQAPKITGMILDLDFSELLDSIKTLQGLTAKIDEGKKLLDAEDD